MMGNSGGRSGGNRVGQGAQRRATERERSYIDPPRDGESRVSIEDEVFPVPGLSPTMVVIYAGMAVAAAAILISLVVAAIWAAAVLGIIN